MTDPSYPLTEALIHAVLQSGSTDHQNAYTRIHRTDTPHPEMPWIVIDTSGHTPDLEAALAQRFTLITPGEADQP